MKSTILVNYLSKIFDNVSNLLDIYVVESIARTTHARIEYRNIIKSNNGKERRRHIMGSAHRGRTR
jgi:hypothetical protein